MATGVDRVWKLHGDGRTVEPGAVVKPNERLHMPNMLGLGGQHILAMFGATALVPVLTAGLALVFLGEVPSAAEIAALITISAGVSIGAAPGKADPMPEARQCSARRQSAWFPPRRAQSRRSGPMRARRPCRWCSHRYPPSRN